MNAVLIIMLIAVFALPVTVFFLITRETALVAAIAATAGDEDPSNRCGCGFCPNCGGDLDGEIDTMQVAYDMDRAAGYGR